MKLSESPEAQLFQEVMANGGVLIHKPSDRRGAIIKGIDGSHYYAFENYSSITDESVPCCFPFPNFNGEH